MLYTTITVYWRSTNFYIFIDSKEAFNELSQKDVINSITKSQLKGASSF